MTSINGRIAAVVFAHPFIEKNCRVYRISFQNKGKASSAAMANWGRHPRFAAKLREPTKSNQRLSDWSRLLDSNQQVKPRHVNMSDAAPGTE